MPLHDVIEHCMQTCLSLHVLLQRPSPMLCPAWNGPMYASIDKHHCIAECMQPTNGCCMQEAGMTLKKEDYTVRVPRSQRGGEIVEPLLREQWFVRMKPLAEPALQVGSACSPNARHFGTNISPDSLMLLRNTCFCCFPTTVIQLTRICPVHGSDAHVHLVCASA